MGGDAKTEKSTFSVPAPIFIKKGSILGGPNPPKISRGEQNAFLQAPGATPKIDLLPKKSLLGGDPLKLKKTTRLPIAPKNDPWARWGHISAQTSKNEPFSVFCDRFSLIF